MDKPMNWYELTPHQRDTLVVKHVLVNNGRLRDYSTDARAADAMEDEIARQGLDFAYLTELARITGDNRVRALYSATPDQRCLAALRAKGVEL